MKKYYIFIFVDEFINNDGTLQRKRTANYKHHLSVYLAVRKTTLT
ncbi:hypothetical protein ACFQDF_31240 [Ectobacillus funiculus]|uniref:Uncharacterized protein n=1 Tax=Ectobacillus funiculus TaxID=137993 RepID=A0ABV5WD45_9BACI